MIGAIFFAAALSCPNVLITNKTSTWVVQDQEALAQAKKRCHELYRNSPCLKTFTKVEDGVYRAICGNK